MVMIIPKNYKARCFRNTKGHKEFKRFFSVRTK